mgnify:CR=1 FL=1
MNPHLNLNEDSLKAERGLLRNLGKRIVPGEDNSKMNWTKAYRVNRDEEHHYFKEAREEVCNINLHQLRLVSVMADVFLLVFILITPLVFPKWKLSWPYYIFCAIMLLFTLLVYVYDRREKKTYGQVMALCVLFDLCLMTGCILIDVIPYPNFVSTYFQIGIVFIAVFFTMPLRLEIPMLTLIEAAYLAAVIAWKTPRMASVDGYESMVGYICSILIAVVVSDLRVKEGLAKYRYIMQGTTDVLTRVRNRAECEKLIRDFLHCRNESSSLCALFMLDMDNFKQVNDSLGHQMGDVVLERVGEILKKEFRADDIIGRIGGDEFLILVKDIHGRENVTKVAERVGESVRQLSAMLDGVQVSCSSGAVIFEGVVEYENLYKMADDSMYEAKRSGGGKCVVQVLRTAS